MSSVETPPLITCFLLKIASRCNINCDYCYMYSHLDQSWKDQPRFMSGDILQKITERVKDYTLTNNIKRIAIVYHGGEPLLFGMHKIVDHVLEFRRQLGGDVTGDFSMQTNGVLLSEEDVILCETHDIQISLSLDGPRTAQDRHRLSHQGKSTFDEVLNALNILKKYPKVFAGVIAVIDTRNTPKETLDFFAELDVPQLDFLLPDANYLRLPAGRDTDPQVYEKWLTECFDYWFDYYPALKIRTFDSIISSLMGCPSETDGFGFGDVSLITIETDGTYHDLDVLKITGNGTSLSKGDVITTSVEDASMSSQFSLHRSLLKKDGLSTVCQNCEVVDVCGGGAVPHRFDGEHFNNPSIYCEELKSLIRHADKRISEQMQEEVDLKEPAVLLTEKSVIREYEMTDGRSNAFLYVLEEFKKSQSHKLSAAIDLLRSKLPPDIENKIQHIPDKRLSEIAIHPAVVAWTDVSLKFNNNLSVHTIDGEVIEPEPVYIGEISRKAENRSAWPSLQSEDRWLRMPFGKQIHFESPELSEEANSVISEAIGMIRSWKPLILDEMALISPEIQFIRDPSAHEDKIVSFSDNSVPGALYVQLKVNKGYVAPEDLADSVIHEHRHQRLYLLQRVCPIVNNDFPLVKSPWREELRPPTGLFHALYVFAELLSFWNLFTNDDHSPVKEKAVKECNRIRRQLKQGFVVVQSCDLTDEGRFILSLLEDKYRKYES